MIVVEVFSDSANVFKTVGNFITYDGELPNDYLGHKIFNSEAGPSTRTIAVRVFSDLGPTGYRAFMAFEGFLQEQGIIPMPAHLAKKRKTSPKVKPAKPRYVGRGG